MSKILLRIAVLSERKQLVFDGHNDVLSGLYRSNHSSPVQSFIEGQAGEIDLPGCKEGGFVGGLFAIFAPSNIDLNGKNRKLDNSNYEFPLPKPLISSVAADIALQQFLILKELEQHKVLKICKSTEQIRSTIDNGALAAVAHMEGADPIDPDLHNLDIFFDAGLRSIGPVWSRNNIFGNGVPFKFPSNADYGDGLTDLGKKLVKRCHELGILIDVSHMNYACFWDIVRYFDQPIIATHSNAHAICPHSRNLDDKQLDAVAESGGLVGLNFASAYLRDDGKMSPDVEIELVFRHLIYLIDKLGENSVAIGSDYDGAVIPKCLSPVKNLQVIVETMRKNNFGEELIKKICMSNWINIFEKIWK